MGGCIYWSWNTGLLSVGFDFCHRVRCLTSLRIGVRLCVRRDGGVAHSAALHRLSPGFEQALPQHSIFVRHSRPGLALHTCQSAG